MRVPWFFTLLLAICLGTSLVSSIVPAPVIKSWTGPTTAATNPGDAQLAATNPFTTRYATAPDLTGRVVVLLPAWASTPYWMGLVHGLHIVGVPMVVVNTTAQLSAATVAIVYTGTEYTWAPTTADIANLQAFVKKGGHLIAMSNVPASLSTLFGVTSVLVAAGSTRSYVQFNNVETTPAVLRGMNWSDSADYTMTILDTAIGGAFQTVGYKAAQTTPAVASLANYYLATGADTSANSAALTVFTPTGYTGYAYAVGIDVGYFYFRAMSESTQIGNNYIGFYQPGYDSILRILKNVFQRTTDFMMLWPVPYNKGITFMTTWDLDTAIAYPHAMAIAAQALQDGANGNVNMHTKYIADAYETDYFQYGVPFIYHLSGFPKDAWGRASIGMESHSVSHSPNADYFPLGTPAVEFQQGVNVTSKAGVITGYAPVIFLCDTSATGTPTNGETCSKGGTSGSSFWTLGGTIFGEVRVSKYLIDSVMAGLNLTQTALTYRPGNLAFAVTQGQVAAAIGYIGGSSCANNGHSTHLPFHVTHNRQPYSEMQYGDYYEMPLSMSDANMNMSSAYWNGSDLQQQSVIAYKISQYGGLYNILIHPSQIMFDKLQLQSALHDQVRPYAYFANTTGIVSFWTARDRVVMSHTTAGTVVTALVVFAAPTNGLTVQVPNTWQLSSVSAGFAACQNTSYDGSTRAVVFTTSIGGTATVKFNVVAANTALSAATACADFTSRRSSQCFGFEVLVASFISTYEMTKGVNDIDMPTFPSANVFTTFTDDQRLQVQVAPDTTTYSTDNYWYTGLSQFCFDITVYTTVSFDLVAAAGSDFFISLLTYDSSCTNQVPTTTYLRVSDYTTMDGKNHTINIPVADFNLGASAQFTQTLKFWNMAPRSAIFYVDNIIIKKRCMYGPGEAGTLGTPIDSFDSIARWSSGYNALGGITDAVSMLHARMPYLNNLILEPNSATSYYYSKFNGTINPAAAGNTYLVISVAGPAGGSFRISLLSGATGATVTYVTSTTYGTLTSTSTPTVFQIPLTAFTGSNAALLYGLQLTTFTPVTAGTQFIVNYISFGPPTGTVKTAAATCAAVPGLAISNYCVYKQFIENVNTLGGYAGDDYTASLFYPGTQNTTSKLGKVEFVPLASTTHWRTVFGSGTGCYDASSYNAVQIQIAGPVGATARVILNAGNATGCAGEASFAATLTFKGLGTPVVATIPITGVTGLSPAYLQSLYVDSWSVASATYEIYYVSLIANAVTNTPLTQIAAMAPASAPSCPTCTGLSVFNWCGSTTIPTTNKLGGYTNDDGTMSGQYLGYGGTLQLVPAAGSYWYTNFGTGCYNVGTATALQIVVNAPAGSKFNIALQGYTDTACTKVGTLYLVSSATYATFDGVNSQTLSIPFKAFTGLDATKLISLSLQDFSQVNVPYSFSCISLTVPPAAVVPECTTCGGTVVATGCGLTAAPTANSLGGYTSDDGTMTAMTIGTGATISLTPNANSYWYSLFGTGACYSAGTATGLNIVASAPAGSNFVIALRYMTNAACTTTGPVLTVSSAAYATFDGVTAKNFTIPFTDFGGIDSTKLASISLQSFTTVGKAYLVSCISLTVVPASAAVPTTSCTTCTGTVIYNLCGQKSTNYTNSLGGYTDDDGSMTSKVVSTTGALQLLPNANSYWYTNLGTGNCYSAGSNTGILITASGPVGSSFVIAVRYKTDAACTVTGAVLTVNSAAYAKFDGVNLKNLSIPFTDFPGLNPARLSSISLQSFSTVGNVYNISCISLAQLAGVASPVVCTTCPATAILDFCANPSVSANVLGGYEGDDSTMATTPPNVVQSGTTAGMALVPAAGSYWYSNLPCFNAASYKYLILTVTMPSTTSTFSIEVQTSSTATGAGCTAGSYNRAAVAVTPYLSTTTAAVAQNVTIPLSAFTAVNKLVDMSRTMAISLSGFTTGTAGGTYLVSCAYFSQYIGGSAGLTRRRARAFDGDEDDEYRFGDEL